MDIYRVTIVDRESGDVEHRIWLGYQSAMNCYHYWRSRTERRWHERTATVGAPYEVTWSKISTDDTDWTPVDIAKEREVRRLLDLWTRLQEEEQQKVLRQLVSQVAIPPAIVTLQEKPEILSKDEKEEAFRRLGVGDALYG